MSNVFEFVAENRDLSGKNAARAVRRNGKVPAVVYGGKEDPQSVVLDHNDVMKHLEHEAVYSHVLDLKVDGKSEKAILKGVQRHPARAQILHMDFMRIDMTKKFKVHVPLHFVNADICPGVKEGGVVTHSMVDVEISCLPAALPEFIEVDLAEVELGGAVHLTDLVVAEDLEIVALAQDGDHNHTVAQVVKTRTPTEDEDEEVVSSSEDDADAEDE